MPITQERMISLCNEGAAQRAAFTRLRDDLLSILRAHRSDPLMAITLIEGTIATLAVAVGGQSHCRDHPLSLQALRQ